MSTFSLPSEDFSKNVKSIATICKGFEAVNDPIDVRTLGNGFLDSRQRSQF